MTNIDDKLLDILEKSFTLGMTAKQLSFHSNLSEENTNKFLQGLTKKGAIIKTGRGLWILAKYKDMISDSLHVSPTYYEAQFKNQYDIILNKYHKEITFLTNNNRPFHRWFHYIQGFSANFVDNMLDKYKIKKGSLVVDPFCGSGTVLVCAKLRGINSIGLDMLPISELSSKVKTNWNIDIKKILYYMKDFNNTITKPRTEKFSIPFLKETNRHFNDDVLNSLAKIKEFVWNTSSKNEDIGNIFKIVFANILIPSSNLKRSPCLGYVDKIVTKKEPFIFFKNKISEINEDLKIIRNNIYKETNVSVKRCDSRLINFDKNSIDLAITSPPYVNGLDYVTNYKIEMAWLEMVKDYNELSKLRDSMLVCDNVSRTCIAEYKPVISDDWISDICKRISQRLSQKTNYRRKDMDLVVKKYFDDLYPTLENVFYGLRNGGRFLIVIGDSLMAGIYIPADLIIARIAKEIGYIIEEVLVTRKRRSGQRHDFSLRETIIVLRKGDNVTSPDNLDKFL